MPELTLTDVFGAGATQTATTLTIPKSAFLDLTASANNSADSLVLALENRFTGVYTQAARNANLDISFVITFNSIPNIVGDFSVNPPVPYQVYTYTHALHLPFNATIPDPDDL